MDESDMMELFGAFEGQCAGCDCYGRVNDLGLCEECDGKMDRDLIRQREWDYSTSAFGCPADKREVLRKQVIRQHGEKLELLAAEKTSKRTKKRKKRRR